MAKKSFVISNGDGRVTFSDSASVSIEDGAPDTSVRGHISASNLYISSSYAIGTITKAVNYRMLSASAGVFVTSSVSGATSPVVGPSGSLGFNGTSSVVTRIMNPSDYAGIPNDQTYLSGNYQEGIKVININTVSSGALKPAYGGTGLTGSQYAASKNLILKGSGSAPTTFSVLSASASGTILVSGEGRFGVQFPSYKPDVRFYGTPGTYTWTRPIGAKFARVILQGAAGGGGGSGISNTTTVINGGGGGAGAFTNVTIDISNIQSASIVVGLGGIGGVCSTTFTGASNGSDGTITYFTASNIYIYANPGKGGAKGNNTNNSAGGAGGTAMPINNGGYSKAGCAGASAKGSGVTGPTTTAYGICGGGGAGGWQNAPNVIALISSTCFGYNTSTDNIDLSTLIFKTGSDGTAYPTPEKAYYGAGGGARYYNNPVRTPPNSDSGGDGYAIIISW